MPATATATRPKKTVEIPPSPAVVDVDLKLHSEEIQSINAVAIAASNGECRGPLVGVNIIGDGTHLTITATNSYHLHQAVVPYSSTKFEATIPAVWLTKTLREVKPAPPMKGRPAPPTTLTIADGSAVISNDAETRTVKLIKDRYPTSSSIIEANEQRPEVSNTEIMVNPQYFASVLRACEVFAGKGYSVGARFKVTGEVTPLSYTVKAGDRTFLAILMPLRMSSY